MSDEDGTPPGEAKRRVIEAHKMGGHNPDRDCTPNEELRALVAEWRNPPEDIPNVAVEIIELCADELEELIENE